MRVRQVTTSRMALTLGTGGQVGPNLITVLTGPNGSGKTEILSALATSNARSPQASRLSGVWIDGDPPSRVIAQTFSPFTRFPPPAQASETSLSGVYARGESSSEKYVCVGLHRAYRGLGGNLTRKVLEESIFRLSESPAAMPAMQRVVAELGFLPRIVLRYRVVPRAKELFEKFEEDNFVEQFVQALAEHHVGSPSTSLAARLRNELRASSIREFSFLLRDSISVVVKSLQSERNHLLILDIDLERFRHEFYLLQALAFLRRLDLLSLASCELYPFDSRNSLDVANTSSGQQQLLCSIFGLTTSVRSNSLVLIDEPELSLHPRWQMQFMDAVVNATEGMRKCHVIVATHSPLIVQSAQFRGAEVVQLGNEQDPSDAIPPAMNQVKSVEETLLDVFSTPVGGSSHVANEIFNAVVEGETGDSQSRVAALSKLRRLDALYRTPIADQNIVRLVGEAMNLLERSAATASTERLNAVSTPYRLTKRWRRA